MNTELDLLKGHFALCLQIFEGIADQAGVNLDGTKLTLSVDQDEASVSVGEMVRKWKEMTADEPIAPGTDSAT